jgi:H+/Cl- antiporter ClcA
LPGLEATPAIATGIAASVAVVLRAPFSAALLAMLLVGQAAADTGPIVVLAAVVGVTVAWALPEPTAKMEVP